MEQEPITPSSGRGGVLIKTWLLVLVTVFFGWDVFWWALGVQPVFPWQLNRTLEENPGYYQLVDTRTAWEFKQFHIDGAKRHALTHLLSDRKPLKRRDPQKPIVVICFSGHRSAIVAFKFRQQGFEEVYNLTWGMVGWVLTGGKTE